MDVKIKAKHHKMRAEFISLAIVSMLYNCIMCVSFCYIAFVKNWWAVLLLIPLCTLTPSLKTKNDEEDEDGDLVL